jgi:D-arabinitol 4-dehydrogenase
MNRMSFPALFETAYNRSDCEIGIVHLGFGAFHRAHQALYVDDYMDQTGDLRWGIAAVNLRAAESAWLCAEVHVRQWRDRFSPRALAC